MYVLMTDETNLNPNDQTKFFIYGGLVFAEDKIPSVHARIARDTSPARPERQRPAQVRYPRKAGAHHS